MRARARTDNRKVTLFFVLVMAVSGVWVPSSAGAVDESEPRPSRGPKRTEQSCSAGESREHDSDDGPRRGHRLGRHRSAAPVQPAAYSGGGSRNGCPDDEPSGAASGSDEQADDRAGPGASDSPEPRDLGSEDERRSPSSPASSGGPSGRPANAGSPASNSAGSNAPGSDRSQASDNGGSGAGDDVSPGSSSGNTNAGGGGGASGDGGSSRGPASGARGGSSGGRGTGGGRSVPSGSVGAGPGGTKGAPAPSGGNGGPAGFRVAPAGPPSGRDRLAIGVAVPAMAWGSLRAPKAALTSSPGILTPVVALPSTAEATTAAVVPSRPLPRTGSEISPSAVLALVLLGLGKVLRRTAR